MATDIEAILSNINSFYDFQDKQVIHVGAGGGQLIGYASNTRSVIAVDFERTGITQLEAAIEAAGLNDRFSVVEADFLTVSARADLVFFEFCLHEMDDAAAALLHAHSLAPEVVVLDHVPDSQWAWHTCEEEKAARSWAAVRRCRVVREKSFHATQHFQDHAELLAKVEVLGEQAIDRSKPMVGQKGIKIEMGYAMVLVQSGVA